MQPQHRRSLRIVTILLTAAALAGCERTEKPAAATTAAVSPMTSPDLTVLSVSAQSSASTGATISVAHTTKNVGTVLAGQSTSKFWLGTNTTAYGSCINQQVIPMLPAGNSATLTNINFTIPANQPLGTNYIIVVCSFNITDSNPSNNTNSTPIVITH